MAPAPKRTKLSSEDKGKGRARLEDSDSEEEDEWASERVAQISDNEEEEDSDGIAQFEDDEDVGELSEEYDEEVRPSLRFLCHSHSFCYLPDCTRETYVQSLIPHGSSLIRSTVYQSYQPSRSDHY